MRQPKSPWTRFSITVRQVGNATILDLDGPLGVGESVQVFRDWVDELLAHKTKNFAINLIKVPYIDSSGIGAFVGAHTAIEVAGGKCKFFAALPRVLQVLKMTHVDEVLDVHNDEPSALSSF